MIAVIDTNIFISGIYWSGTPYELLKLWVAKKFQIVFTTETLNECFRVLKEFGKEKDSSLAEEWILFISKNSKLVDQTSKLALCRDKDLADLKEIKGVKIIKPKQFYDMIKNSSKT